MIRELKAENHTVESQIMSTEAEINILETLDQLSFNLLTVQVREENRTHQQSYLRESSEQQSSTLYQQRIRKQEELAKLDSSRSELTDSINILKETLTRLHNQKTELLVDINMSSPLSHQIHQVKSTLFSLRSTLTHTSSIQFDDTLGLVIEQFTLLPEAQPFHLCFYQLLKPFLPVILCSTYTQSQVWIHHIFPLETYPISKAYDSCMGVGEASTNVPINY